MSGVSDKIADMPQDVRDKLNEVFAAIHEAGKAKGEAKGRKEGEEKGRKEGVALAVQVLAPSETPHPIVNDAANENPDTQIAITNTQQLAHRVCMQLAISGVLEPKKNPLSTLNVLSTGW